MEPPHETVQSRYVCWRRYQDNTKDHISLTSFSKRRVDLAAQVSHKVFSESVLKALYVTGGDEATETAHFVGMIDKCFDCLNVHNYTHGIHLRKVHQMPYTTGKDRQLKVSRNWSVYVLFNLFIPSHSG